MEGITSVMHAAKCTAGKSNDEASAQTLSCANERRA